MAKRAGIISRQILKAFNKAVPPLTATEREALESGTVGWDGELFSGKPKWDKLFSLPKPGLTAEEQAFLDGPVNELCAMISDWDISQSEEKDTPPHVWDFIKKNKFLAIELPKEYGGLGFSTQAHSAILVKIASRSFSAAINVMVPNSLGPAELIHEYGTEAQKQKYLHRLANGDDIPCFALTEPHAGSDATSIQTRGIVRKNAEGKAEIHIPHIEKRYITLAPIATLIGMAVDLHDPENLLGKGTHPGITVALIPRDTPGLSIGNRHKPMDIAFQNGPIRGSVTVGVDNVVGGMDGVGKGWMMLVEQLGVGRAISLPAVSTAGGKLASTIVGDYSRIRKQFSFPIGMFEGVEEPMARIAGNTYIADAARTATVQMVDRGEKPAIPSAILKYHLTEGMRKSVIDGMDILGGKAVMSGPQNSLGLLYRGTPIAITVEGANIMTRNLIIFGQGGVRAHPYLLREMEAASQADQNKAAKDLSKLLFSHVGSVMANTGRSLAYNFTRGFGSHVPVKDKDVAAYYRHINRISASFNLIANATLGLLGGDLKRKERVSARLGDVLSNMYLASTTLRHYEANGRNKDELAVVKWACHSTIHNAEKALDDLLRNYPNKTIGKLLRMFVLPFGPLMKPPSDEMDRAAARVLYNGGEARKRLTSGLFIPGENQKDDPIYRLEDAYKKTVAAEPLEKKLREATKAGTLKVDAMAVMIEAAAKAGIVTADEAKQLLEADKARNLVINVDDFEVEKPMAARQNPPKPAAA